MKRKREASRAPPGDEPLEEAFRVHLIVIGTAHHGEIVVIAAKLFEWRQINAVLDIHVARIANLFDVVREVFVVGWV